MSALASPRGSQKKQCTIERFASSIPGQEAVGEAAGGDRKCSPPPPPARSKLKGAAVVKDFVDEATGVLRPFRGKVTAVSRRTQWYQITYEDDDQEEVDWEELSALMRRAAAEDAKQVVAQQAPPIAAEPPAKAKQAKRDKETQLPDIGRKGSKLAVAASEQALKPASKRDGKPSKRLPAAEEGMVRKGKTEQEVENSCPTAVQAKPKPRIKGTSKGTGNSSKGSSSKAAPPAGKPASGKKRKAAEDAADAGGGAKKQQQRKAAGPAIELPLPKAGQEYVYKRGVEPWRCLEGFQWAVHDELDLSAAAVNRMRTVQRAYTKYLIRAEPEEKKRVEAVLAQLKAEGMLGKLPRPANRPDRTAEHLVKADGLAVRDPKVAGHYPGWDVNGRAYSRAEISCMGLHFPPIAGIDYVPAEKAGKGCPPFATSVMVSGWYQDDCDDGSTLWYTGEGGNDLLHKRNQVADQKLHRGNAALMGNIQLGVPVRVTRKQKDELGHYGCAYVYDGLYDVVAYRHVKGQENTLIYQFLLRRRPGQGPLISERVKWGTIAAKRDVKPQNRPGVVDLDISRGQEASPIAAVDDTWIAHGDHHQPQGDIPACTGLEHVVEENQLAGKVMRGINQERINQLRNQGYRPSVQYITRYEFVGRAAGTAGQLRAAELPPRFRDNPHGYLRELNHGIPYNDKGQLFHPQPMVYECSGWAGCPHGDKCSQAVTQRPSRYRLELFKTGNGRGWGVRSLDMIPQHGYVCTYLAQVYDAAEHEQLVRTVEEQDAEYTFDMGPRPDTNWDGSEKAVPDTSRAEFVACGLRKRNVGAFLNHSCAPNCFVQPVLDTHHDTRCPKICIFASDNIAPMTELTLDYGEAYAAGFRGGCKCGAADCISQRIPRAATAPVADSPTACPLAAAAAAPASSSRAATSSDD